MTLYCSLVLFFVSISSDRLIPVYSKRQDHRRLLFARFWGTVPLLIGVRVQMYDPLKRLYLMGICEAFEKSIPVNVIFLTLTIYVILCMNAAI